MLKTVSSITNAIGALNFKGTWDAATNTPTIISGVGVKGDYFVVSVEGSTIIDGISNWGIGDWIAYNGNIWQRVEGGADGNFVNLTASGQTTVTGNTAATPAVAAVGDTNTGVFFPAADEVGIAVNGVEAIRVDSAGNVGVGTSTPTGKLDVVGTTVSSVFRSSTMWQVKGDRPALSFANGATHNIDFATTTTGRSVALKVRCVGLATSVRYRESVITASLSTGVSLDAVTDILSVNTGTNFGLSLTHISGNDYRLTVTNNFGATVSSAAFSVEALGHQVVFS